MDDIQTSNRIEEESRTLRLAEQALFKQVVQNLRGKYRKLILALLLSALGIALVWGFFACSWLHRFIPCPMLKH